LDSDLLALEPELSDLESEDLDSDDFDSDDFESEELESFDSFSRARLRVP
jgi:hypothetical protein